MYKKYLFKYINHKGAFEDNPKKILLPKLLQKKGHIPKILDLSSNYFKID